MQHEDFTTKLISKETRLVEEQDLISLEKVKLKEKNTELISELISLENLRREFDFEKGQKFV